MINWSDLLFSNKMYRQIVGILKNTNSAPFRADLFLYRYAIIAKLSKEPSKFRLHDKLN